MNEKYSRAHKCLVELQTSNRKIKEILKEYKCTITFEYEHLAGYNKCVAILSDGINRITADAITRVDYKVEKTANDALGYLTGRLWLT